MAQTMEEFPTDENAKVRQFCSADGIIPFHSRNIYAPVFKRIAKTLVNIVFTNLGIAVAKERAVVKAVPVAT